MNRVCAPGWRHGSVGMAEGQQIDYEALAQEAMRGVVRAVLTKVAASGLLGEHHFYIAFNTQAAGVNISKRLKEKYPEEMTIVLQHRFWDLEVNDERFEVKLTFDGIPERLVVPFRAVKVFYDPSVPYGLQFEESELMAHAARRVGRPRDSRDGAGEAGDDQSTTARSEKRAQRTSRKSRPAEVKQVPEAAAGQSNEKIQLPSKPAGVASSETAPSPAAKSSDAPEPAANPDASKVVDFSKFRNQKK